MPVFVCSNCSMMENTATTDYWWWVTQDKKPPLCSECHPEIKKWHGEFPRSPMPPDHVIGPDGFVWQKDDPYLKRQLEEKRQKEERGG